MVRYPVRLGRLGRGRGRLDRRRPVPVPGGACSTLPAQAAAAASLVVDNAGNGVYQPNETVVVAPTWRNTGANAITLTGTLTNHTGPAGPARTPSPTPAPTTAPSP